MSEAPSPQQLVAACQVLVERGWGTSTSGNLSCRCGDDVYATPTGVALGEVSADGLSRVDLQGRLLDGPRPTKELGLHLAVYRMQPNVRAVVHAHPAHAVALSTLVEGGSLLPSMTPQFVMRAGRVPVLQYAAPGDHRLGGWLADSQPRKAACLQNHGVLTFGADFRQAVGTLEELEENCRLWLLTGGRGRSLDEREIAELLGRQM